VWVCIGYRSFFAIGKEATMSKIIVVPLDGSTLADAAVAHAVGLARGLGGALRVVRVHPPLPPLAVEPGVVTVRDEQIETEIVTTERAWLETRARQIRASSGLPVTTEFRVGRPGEEIVEAAADCNAAMIVCTTHGSGGWAPQWMGSVTDHVIRHASRPVLAMSAAAAERTTTPERMLVLLDGSELAESILPSMADLAKAFHARIELFRVVVPPWAGNSEMMIPPEVDRFGIDGFADEAKRELEEIAGDLREKGLTVKSAVEVGTSAARRILQHIETSDPDLVALATHGRGLARIVVGSVADKVLRSGARPMLCVRPQRGAGREPVRRVESSVAAVPAATPV
jgi:nucleotide-binding universal stress UspA family protein